MVSDSARNITIYSPSSFSLAIHTQLDAKQQVSGNYDPNPPDGGDAHISLPSNGMCMVVVAVTTKTVTCKVGTLQED